MLRKILTATAATAVVLAGSIAGPMTAEAAPATAATSSTYCAFGNWNGSKSVLVSAHKRPVITHIHNYTVGPKYSKTTTRKVYKQTVLSGSVRLGGEVSTALGNKIIGRGEAKLGIEMAGSGQRTSSSTEQVTEKVRNPTNHNVTMVFFRGNTQGYGKWKKSYCRQISGSIGEVTWSTGTWKSFVTYGDGYVLCGQGTKNINALAKKAYRIGCA